MGKVCAVIVAAGKGKRMGAGINKQFINLGGKPVLYHTIKAFSDNTQVDSIVVVCAKDEIDYCRNEIIEKYSLKKIFSVTEGGAERPQSVYNGLKIINDCEIVLIHDGARPFVSDSIIYNGIQYAKVYGACACGVHPKDTIKTMDEKSFSSGTLDRQELFAVQTPQCFNYSMILSLYERLGDSKLSFTDDTSVAEYFGHKVYLYNGSYSNIKITTPEDLDIAENILNRNNY